MSIILSSCHSHKLMRLSGALAALHAKVADRKDPDGCICEETWKTLLRFDPLNEPNHCDHFLHETAALQHLIFRWDLGGKITGRYCKYTKNTVMRFQRASQELRSITSEPPAWEALNADGRTKLWDWKALLLNYGNPYVEDSGGLNQLKPY